MKQKLQLSTLILMLGCLYAQSEVSALNTTNEIKTISQIVQSTSKAWEKNPELYFKRLKKDLKFFNHRVISQDEYPVFYGSFTNMIHKNIPSPTDDMKAPGLLLLQNSCIKEYTQNEKIRNDKKTWFEIAEHIGKLRSQIIPDYIEEGYPLNTPWDMMPPSAEKDRCLLENRRKVTNAQYQRILQHGNQSLSSLLNIYLKNLRHHKDLDMNYIQKLLELAKFTEKEKQEILDWFNEK